MEQLQCVVETFLACFFAFLIFDPKCRFCKGYSLCLVANFGNFQNGLIFQILAAFWSRCIGQVQSIVETVLACIFAFFLNSKHIYSSSYIVTLLRIRRVILTLLAIQYLLTSYMILTLH